MRVEPHNHTDWNVQLRLFNIPSELHRQPYQALMDMCTQREWLCVGLLRAKHGPASAPMSYIVANPARTSPSDNF